jgi:hypothetical protein
MPRHPFSGVWSNGYPTGADNRGASNLNPAHYPVGSPQNPAKKGDRARAATARVLARVTAATHEVDVGELVVVTDRDVERVRLDDLSHAAEFYGEAEE